MMAEEKLRRQSRKEMWRAGLRAAAAHMERGRWEDRCLKGTSDWQHMGGKGDRLEVSRLGS